jgi:hypothetical protein
MSKERDRLRGALFASKKRNSKLITLFDVEVEIRQPTVGEMLALSGLNENDRRKSLVSIMVNYCFVPGTDEPIFDKSDEDGIMNWPVGEWFTTLNDAVAEMTNLDVAGQEKNLE